MRLETSHQIVGWVRQVRWVRRFSERGRAWYPCGCMVQLTLAWSLPLIAEALAKAMAQC